MTGLSHNLISFVIKDTIARLVALNFMGCDGILHRIVKSYLPMIKIFSYDSDSCKN